MLKTNDLYLKKLEAEAERLEGRVKRVVSAAGSQGALDKDLLNGMRRSVRNSQQRLALEYLAEIVEAQAAQIEELQEAVAGFGGKAPTEDPEPTMPGQPAPKPEPTKEAEPVEERKKAAPKKKPEVEAEPTE